MGHWAPVVQRAEAGRVLVGHVPRHWPVSLSSSIYGMWGKCEGESGYTENIRLMRIFAGS